MTWWDDYLDAWNAHDGQRIVTFMTEDVVYTDVAMGQEHKGHADVSAWAGGMAEGFSSDVHFEPVWEFGTDEAYALEWIMKGTNDHATALMPATGKTFAVRGVSVGELEGGKIKRNTDYWSIGELMTQLGLMPQPGAA